MANNIWVATDWHLMNKRVEPRHPYRTISNLEKLAVNYANDIQEDDLFIYLGDLCDPAYTDLKKLKAIIGMIPGYKIMCRGNHDTEDDSFYLDLGFDRICEVAKCHNILFSHIPLKITDSEKINVHGHLHTRMIVTDRKNSANWINAYDSNFNDHSTLLDDLLEKAPYQKEKEFTDTDQNHIKEMFDQYTNMDPGIYTNIINISDMVELHYHADDMSIMGHRASEYVDAENVNEASSVTAKEMEVPQFKSDTDLYNYMHKNIRYKNFTKLMTAQEVEATKEGACHDQVMYELYALRKIPGISKVKAWFILEYDESSGQGGETHSVVQYNKAGGTYYIENAWSDNAGIHKLNKTVPDLFEEYHESGKWGNKDKYPEIDVGHFPTTPGMSLQDMLNDGSVNESTVKNISYELPKKALSYDPPMNASTVKNQYGEKLYKKLYNDPVHRYRMDSGIELIHKEPTRDELVRICSNWLAMDSNMQKESDKMSMKLFGMNNIDHYVELIQEYDHDVDESANILQDMEDYTELRELYSDPNKQSPTNRVHYTSLFNAMVAAVSNLPEDSIKIEDNTIYELRPNIIDEYFTCPAVITEYRPTDYIHLFVLGELDDPTANTMYIPCLLPYMKANGANFVYYTTSKVNEAAAETHEYDHDKKKEIADKYGLRDVGYYDKLEEEKKDQHELEAKEAEKRRKERQRQANAEKARQAKEEKRKAVAEREDARRKQLLKARKIKARKAKMRKFKQAFSHKDKITPKNEDATNLMENYHFECLDKNLRFFDPPLNEAANKDEKLYPVYVILIHSGTTLATIIKNVTGADYSHASISFDSSLRHMYSFGSKKMPDAGFKTEDVKSDFYKSRTIPYAIYVVPSTKTEISLMKKRLDYFIANHTKFKFDFAGLVKTFFHIADDPQWRYFCSRFVADVLKAGHPDDKDFIPEPSLIKPEDFQHQSYAIYVTGGENINDYDQKLVDKKTKQILNKERAVRKLLAENTVIDEDAQYIYPDAIFDPYDPLQEAVLDYKMAMLDEEAVDNFIQYLKSFKVRFDRNGNVIITRREYDDLSKHFHQSLRMLKTYEKAGNVEGVKEELAKINYMIELINNYYLSPKTNNNPKVSKDIKKEMLDLRSVMMNVFQQHLTWITSREPHFNFQRYYDSSKYGKDIKIPKTVMDTVTKSLVTVLG